MGCDVGLLGSAFVYHGGMVSRNDANGVLAGMGTKIRGANAGNLAEGGSPTGNPLPEKMFCTPPKTRQSV